jgi:hypothetical protein
MIAWWRAEGNTLDAVTTHHGALVGGVIYDAGRVGQAFRFDSLDGYNDPRNGCIAIPDVGNAYQVFELEPTNLTVEAWVMIKNPGGGTIIAKPLTRSTSSSGGVYFDQTLDSYAMWMGAGLLYAGVTDRSGNSRQVLYNLGPDATLWYHVAFTYDSISKLESLYVNGVRVATNSADNIGYCINCGNSTVHDTHDVLLGADVNNGNTNGLFNGRIDEAAIYNRALGSNEIAAIYGAGDVGKVFLSDLQKWKLAYLGDINAPDAGDADGDGASNIQEYLAGTDPTNSASTFRITAIAKENKDIRVTWSMGSGRTNALQFTPGFNTNFQDLFVIANTVGSVTNYLDRGAATNASARFYRVSLSSAANSNTTGGPPSGVLRLAGNGHTMSGTAGYYWNSTSAIAGVKMYFDYGDNGFGGPNDTYGSTDATLAPNITITNGLHIQVRGDYVEASLASLHLVLTLSNATTLSLDIPNTPINTAFTPVAFSDSNGDHWQVSGTLATGGDLVSVADSVPNGNVIAPFNNPDTSWHLTFAKIPLGQSNLRLTGNSHNMHSSNGYSWDTVQNGIVNLYFDAGDDNTFDTSGDTVASLAPNITITNGLLLQVRGDLVAPPYASITLLLVLTLTDNTSLNLNLQSAGYLSTPDTSAFTPVNFSDSNGDHWQVSGTLATGGDVVNALGIGADGYPDTSWHLTFTKVP